MSAAADKEEMDPSQCRRHLFLFQFVKMGNGKCVFHLSEEEGRRRRELRAKSMGSHRPHPNDLVAPPHAVEDGGP